MNWLIKMKLAIALAITVVGLGSALVLNTAKGEVALPSSPTLPFLAVSAHAPGNTD